MGPATAGISNAAATLTNRVKPQVPLPALAEGLARTGEAPAPTWKLNQRFLSGIVSIDANVLGSQIGSGKRRSDLAACEPHSNVAMGLGQILMRP